MLDLAILDTDLNSAFDIRTEGNILFLFSDDYDFIRECEETLEDAGFELYGFVVDGLGVFVESHRGQSVDQIAELLGC